MIVITIMLAKIIMISTIILQLIMNEHSKHDDNTHSVNNDAMMPRNARMMLTIMNDYDDNA